MKIIISTGHGRLHLFESAKAIKKAGIKINIITGWVPSKKFSNNLLNIMGKLIGRNDLAYGLRKRMDVELKFSEVCTCSFSEFFIQFLFFLAQYKVVKYDNAAMLGWKIFGWQSKKYIHNASIFHVRSGAGQGGAIKKARESGMKIVVDHSIAHPIEVYKQLLKANNGDSKKISISPNSKFWNLVLKDCEDADLIQVNSEYVKQSFIENNFSSKKIRVINLGISPKFISIKKDYSCGAKIKILFTGSFGLRKGAHLIVAAIQHLIEQRYSFKLDIIGPLVNDFELPNWFNEHPDIILHGYIPQDDLKKYLNSSDLYVFPSYCEGAAQSLKEAMGAGMPVISTIQSGGPIIHGKNGWVIPDNSFMALANAIIQLRMDEGLRRRLGQSAIKTITEEHTWTNYGEKTIKQYKALLDHDFDNK